MVNLSGLVDRDDASRKSPSSSPTSRRSAASRRTPSRPTAGTSRRSPSSATGTTAAGWSWTTVDRLGLRGFLGELQRRGLAKRSAARALSAVRSLYRFLQEQSRRDEHRRPFGEGAQARQAPADLHGPARDRPPLRVGRVARRGRRVRADPRSGHPRAVLFHRHPPVRAERPEPPGPRSPLRSGQGAGQGAQGADRAGGLAGGAGAPPLSSPPGGDAGAPGCRPAGGLREPERHAAWPRGASSGSST